jgi:hypothetical protein
VQLKSIHDFAGAANQEFQISLGTSTMTVTLIEISPLKPHVFPGMSREPFSLLFKSESSLILPQKLYRMDNAALGSQDMFLVPVARDGSAVVYQAVFN